MAFELHQLSQNVQLLGRTKWRSSIWSVYRFFEDAGTI